MTVIVDNLRAPARVGRINARWSHLTATTPEELHNFAATLGLQRTWYQDHGDDRWHYDVTDTKRARAIQLGALAVDLRVLGAFVSARRHHGPAAAEAVLTEHQRTALTAPDSLLAVKPAGEDS